jgi:hypothetical protein
MDQHEAPVIDMTPDGQFLDPPKPSIFTYLLRLAAFGLALAIAAALFWAAIIIIPLLLLAGLIAYLILRPRITVLRPGRF